MPSEGIFQDWHCLASVHPLVFDQRATATDVLHSHNRFNFHECDPSPDSDHITTEARPQTGRFGAGVCPCPNLGGPNRAI
jgi:hypothetical protein